MIKRLVKSGLAYGMQSMPFTLSRALLGQEIMVACYHAVADEPPPHLKHIIACRSRATFQRDLEFFAQHYSPIGLKDLLDHVQHGRALPRHPLLLTFDDGLSEVSSIAPMCHKLGIPATLFLTTDALEQKQLLHRHKASLLVEALSGAGTSPGGARAANLGITAGQVLALEYSQTAKLDEIAVQLGVDFDDYLRSHKPYLNVEQVQQLMNEGFSVGAHSVDHPHYSSIPLEQQLWQTRQSISTVQRLFNLDYRVFAVPFVCDGIPPAFYQQLFAEPLVDLLFCIGSVSHADSRIVQRTWLESSADRPVQAMLRTDHFSRLMNMLRNSELEKPEPSLAS